MSHHHDYGACMTCGVLLTKKSREDHHFPMPARLGGNLVVPLCLPCHDMVDRKNLEDWPCDWVFSAWASLPREGKLLLMKTFSRITAPEHKPLLSSLAQEAQHAFAEDGIKFDSSVSQ